MEEEFHQQLEEQYLERTTDEEEFLSMHRKTN